MGALHKFRTILIAICAASALLCASCATSAVEESENATPKKRAQIFASLGTHALLRGDASQAVIDLRKALELDSENVGALNNLGLAYWQLGKKDLSKNTLQKAAKLQPDNGDTNINLGTIALEENKPTEARRYYQNAIDNLEYKMRHRALTNMAELALRENRTDEARRLLYQSLQVNPDYCLSHFLLGGIYSRESNIPAAVTELKKSVRATCAGNVEAHYQLGLAYSRMKNYEQARSEFRHLIENFPQTTQAQSAAEQLKALP